MTGFIRRKIKLKPTLGELLKSAREERKITLFGAEAGSKVRAKYLAAIENSNWNILPGEVYTRGFVLAYTKFLELDVSEMIGLYEKESAFLKQKQAVDLSYNYSFKGPKILVTPKTLAYAALAVSVLFMFSFIIYQVLGFAGSPALKITNPSNNVITESDMIDLAGITDVEALVAVNNETVPVTSDGHFNLNMQLHRGVNVIKIQAVNKAKKESSEIYTIEYRPKTAAADESAKESNF